MFHNIILFGFYFCVLYGLIDTQSLDISNYIIGCYEMIGNSSIFIEVGVLFDSHPQYLKIDAIYSIHRSDVKSSSYLRRTYHFTYTSADCYPNFSISHEGLLYNYAELSLKVSFGLNQPTAWHFYYIFKHEFKWDLIYMVDMYKQALFFGDFQPDLKQALPKSPIVSEDDIINGVLKINQRYTHVCLTAFDISTVIIPVFSTAFSLKMPIAAITARVMVGNKNVALSKFPAFLCNRKTNDTASKINLIIPSIPSANVLFTFVSLDSKEEPQLLDLEKLRDEITFKTSSFNVININKSKTLAKDDGKLFGFDTVLSPKRCSNRQIQYTLISKKDGEKHMAYMLKKTKITPQIEAGFMIPVEDLTQCA